MAKKRGTEDQEFELSKPAQEMEPISPKQKEEGDKIYVQKVIYFQGKELETLQNILLLHWEKGSFVADLLRSPAKFGNITLEGFAKDMKVSTQAVRSWHRFFVIYPNKDDVDRLVRLKLPWRGIQALLAGDMTPVDRKMMETKLAKNEIDSNELKTKVQEMNRETRKTKKARGEKTEKRGGNPPSSALKNLVGGVEFLSKRLTKGIAALDDIKDFKGRSLKRSLEARKLAVERVKELQPKIDRFLEIAGKAELADQQLAAAVIREKNEVPG